MRTPELHHHLFFSSRVLARKQSVARARPDAYHAIRFPCPCPRGLCRRGRGRLQQLHGISRRWRDCAVPQLQLPREIFQRRRHEHVREQG